MDIKEILDEYYILIPFYQKLEKTAKKLIQETIEGKKIHSIQNRIKSIESIKEKVYRKRAIGTKIENPFKEFNDILGFRIICLFRTDINSIIQKLKSRFNLYHKEDYCDNEPMYFGYRDDKLIVNIGKNFSISDFENIKEFNFEIQIMTIAMNAWTSISHDIYYKKEDNIPDEIKKDFFALNALFFLADSQFESFDKSRKKYLKEILDDESILNAKINIDTLKAYLEWRFSDRENLTSMYYLLLGLLRDANLQNINEIEKICEKAYDVFLRYEKDYISRGGDEFHDVDVITGLLYLVGMDLPDVPRLIKLKPYRKYVKND